MIEQEKEKEKEREDQFCVSLFTLFRKVLRTKPLKEIVLVTYCRSSLSRSAPGLVKNKRKRQSLGLLLHKHLLYSLLTY